MDELWAAVPGFVGYYEISSLGRCRSVSRLVLSKGGSQQFRRGQMLRPREQFNGYIRYALAIAGKYKHVLAHRLVLQAFRGAAPDGAEARHLDGVRSNNALHNLVWGTKLENAADRVHHGKQVFGARVSTAKLTDGDVWQIKVLLRHGNLSQAIIGRMFGVNQSKISAIKLRQTWRHVED